MKIKPHKGGRNCPILLTLTESERDLFDKARGKVSRPDFLMMLLDQHKANQK